MNDSEAALRADRGRQQKDGQDTLYPGVVEIDDEVIEEHWRGEPGRRDKTFRSIGVHGDHATR